MRTAPNPSWLLFLAFAACSGDGQSDDGPTDGNTNQPPEPIQFSDTVGAIDFEAEVPDDILQAQQMANAFFTASAVVVADEKVQDQLNINGGGEFRDSHQCWTRPDFPKFSFTIDYTGCEYGYDMTGGVYVSNHPSGPLLLQFLDFTIEDRIVGGTLGLDTTNAYPEPLYWLAYNTDVDAPGPDNLVPIGIAVDGANAGLTYDGGASVNFLEQTWSMWGVATVQPDDEPITIVHGGTDPSQVPGDAPPGTDAPKVDLNAWSSCRCPTSGISTYDFALKFTEITVDLDDLLVNEDEIDDPVIDLQVDVEIPGKAILEYTGCAEYDVTFENDTTSVAISNAALTGAVSRLCDLLVIEDEVRCSNMIGAAAAIPELTVEISEEQINQAATDAVGSDFDVSYCKIN